MCFIGHLLLCHSIVMIIFTGAIPGLDLTRIIPRESLITLIFLAGEMLEKFLWRSDYIFGLSLMPENQSSKKFSILTSRFEGQVQTACSHHGPSAKWSLYLILTSAIACRLDTVLSESEKNSHLSTLDPNSKVCQPTKPFPSKSNKSRNTIFCTPQFRRNLKIKNQSISPKWLVGIRSNISHHVLQNFLD